MKRALKVQLMPNNKQLSKFFSYSGSSRFAYNWALAKEMESLKNEQKFIPDGELRKEFTRLKKQDGYKWLNDIDVDVTKQAIKDLCKAYMTYFKTRKKAGYKKYSKKYLAKMKSLGQQPVVYHSNGHPKFKTRKNTDDYGFYQDVCKVKFTNNSVHLVLVAGRGKAGSARNQKICNVKLAEKGRIPLNCKYMNPRVSYDGINWWLSVVIEINDNDLWHETHDSGDGVGIDLGIKDLAICSDGFTYRNINKEKVIKKLEKRKCRLNRSISRKYRMNNEEDEHEKTANIKKAETKLLRIEKRLANIRQNYIHQVTTEIIKRKPNFICIEDLNVSGMMKNKHLAKAVQNQNLRMFRNVITYKAKWNDIPLIIADRYYASSKTCSCCSNIKQDLKLNDRVYRCDVCGLVLDRDFNASLNLRKYGKERAEIA